MHDPSYTGGARETKICGDYRPQRGLVGLAVLGLGLGVAVGAARAEIPPTTPDVQPGPAQPIVPPAHFRPTWDLDGFYIWLGPVASASYVASAWDTTFGGDLSIMRVREHAALGAIGGSFGAARWTERGGGRLWLDALAGTTVGGHMVGVTAGPILELADDTHARLGGSIGVWAFAGITPYARIGEVSDLGVFVDLGVHIALPVFRR